LSAGKFTKTFRKDISWKKLQHNPPVSVQLSAKFINSYEPTDLDENFFVGIRMVQPSNRF